MGTFAKLSSFRDEHLLDVFNDAANHIRELNERWNNRLTLPGDSIVEQYEKGRLSLICDLAIASPKLVSGTTLTSDNPRVDDILIASIICNADTVDHINAQHWQQEPMLVKNVQIVQGPKGIIASLVRLYDFHDEVANCFGGLMYYSAIYGGYKFISRFSKREAGVFVIAMQSSKDNLVDGDVQGRFKVVKGVTQDKGQSASTRFDTMNLDYDKILSRLTIILDSQRVRATLCDGKGAGVKVIDVLLGPLNL